MLMIGRKWADTKLCGLAAAYEVMIAEWREANDAPKIMPRTELCDILKSRLQDETKQVSPCL